MAVSRGSYVQEARRPIPRRAKATRRGPRRAPIIVLGALVVLTLALGAGVYLYDQSRREVIAKGVRVGGVDLGGLNVVAARQRLRSRLAASLASPVTVTYHSRSFTLTARQAHRSVDINGLVHRALNRSRSGSIISRTADGLLGTSLNVDIPLTYRYRHAAVRAFAARVAAAVNRPAHDATVQPNSSGALVQVASHDGVSVAPKLLTARINTALEQSHPPGAVVVPAHVVKPAVSSSQLAARYPSYVVVDRASFTLRLYRSLKLSSSYPIAVGMQGLETPAGLWHIQWMQVNPPWYVPNSAWAGKLAGTVVPPGPADPLKARFMSFNGGAGIHGIDPSEYGTLGHTASHGCIRMTIPDVIDLYSKVRVGTPVYIV